jgi:hypothetical protein
MPGCFSSASATPWGRRLAPLDVDEDALDAEGLADLAPALAELAAADDERLVARAQEVRDGGLHAHGARARQHERQLLGLEQPAQAVLDLAQALHEDRRAVIKDGPRHGEQDALGHGRRTGGEEVFLHGERRVLLQICVQANLPFA